MSQGEPPPIQSGAQRLTQQAVFHVAAIEETVQIAIEAGRFFSWRHVVVSGMKHVVIQTTHPAETRPEFRERFGLELRVEQPVTNCGQVACPTTFPLTWYLDSSEKSNQAIERSDQSFHRRPADPTTC